MDAANNQRFDTLFSRRCSQWRSYPKQVYTSEYREQAVQMIVRDKLSVSEVSRKLSMPPQTLANRVKRVRDGQLPQAGGEAGARRRIVTDEQAEWSRLRREVAELLMERDMLKKPPRSLRLLEQST